MAARPARGSRRVRPPAETAHVTGGLAVCAGSCGPGNLHLINGLFDCHRSRVPVVAIAASLPSPEIGSGYFQETHPEQLSGNAPAIGDTCFDRRQMPRALEIAVRRSIYERCVSVIVIPGDVALKPAATYPRRCRWASCRRSRLSCPLSDARQARRSPETTGRRVTLLCGKRLRGRAWTS